MAFLLTSTKGPQYWSAVLLWHKIKKHITILGICSMKTGGPLDVITSVFEVMTSRLVCRLFNKSGLSEGIIAVNMQVCVLKEFQTPLILLFNLSWAEYE